MSNFGFANWRIGKVGFEGVLNCLRLLCGAHGKGCYTEGGDCSGGVGVPMDSEADELGRDEYVAAYYEGHHKGGDE